MAYRLNTFLTMNCIDKKNNGKPFRTQTLAFLRNCNSLLTTLENKLWATGSHVDISARDKSQQLIGFLLSNSILGMLGDKYY